MEKRYGKSRLIVLIQSVFNFICPSKQEDNSPIMIGNHRIDKELLSEIPNQMLFEAGANGETAREFKDVTIELHAQDLDRTKQGWAGICAQIYPKRLKMEISPPIKPDDLFNRSKVTGDIMVIYKRGSDGEMKPNSFHLLHVDK